MKTYTAEQAALMAEVAYRRGFQQGATFYGGEDLDDEEIYKWRYETPLDFAYGAPEPRGSGGYKTGLVERHIEIEKFDSRHLNDSEA